MKALFDYFIFHTDGPPMEHWPMESQGVLGAISKMRAKPIWAHFTSLVK